MTSTSVCRPRTSLHPIITENLIDTTKYYCPFLDRGFCRDKSKCNFSHERNNSIRVPLEYCHFYLANRCLFGAECKFQHIEPLGLSTSNTSISLEQGNSNNTIGEHSQSILTDLSPSTSSNFDNEQPIINITSRTTIYNNISKCNRDSNVNHPPTYNPFSYRYNNNVAHIDSNRQLSQPTQFAHHSQYWYHPRITSNRVCPFLGGIDDMNYHYTTDTNSLQYSNDLNNSCHDDELQNSSIHQNITDECHNPQLYTHQHNHYHHDGTLVSLRLSSSLPSLLSDHVVDQYYAIGTARSNYEYQSEEIEEQKEVQEIKEEKMNQFAWTRHHETFCRRHSIGHIDMISDEHLLLSCDLCGHRCLEPNDTEQQRLHRDECLRELEQEMELSFAIQRSKDKVCGICMDIVIEKKPVTSSRFGILEKCSHIFCLDCIRKWRGTKQFENRTIRACPECRTCSDFVVPSKYWVEDKDDKEKLIHDYKANLKSKACKYFDQGRGECPFAGACFYKHAYPDGRIAKLTKPKGSRRYNSRGISLAAARLIVWNLIRNADDDDEEEENDDDVDDIIGEIEIITDDEDDDEEEDADEDEDHDEVDDDNVSVNLDDVANDDEDNFDIPTFEDYYPDDCDETSMHYLRLS